MLNRMIIKTVASLLLFFLFAVVTTAEPEPEKDIKLHVIYSEKLQTIMHKLSLSVYEEELTLEQINKLFDNASELYIAAKELDQAIPGIELTYTEKNIFENIARQLQIEANNMGFMAKNNDKEGLQMTYDRLSQTCSACHDLFRY
jgi:cytochrome c556